jgi:acetoin utilization deacetylase AcuC-like enzyme
VRPPGHHAGYVGATAECGQHGFCFFNNVVLGATHARLQWGMKRFAVIDIDVHYGNGTAELLEHDEEAFFASLHLKHNDFFPSDACIGDDVDTKNRVSIGLQPNQKGKTSRGGSDTAATGAAAFRHVLSTRILPRCKEFQPDLIFISAGFDGLATDPVGGELGLSVEDYRWATEQIVQVAEECCEGRLVSVLEGGYDIDKGSMSGLVQAVDAHVGVLMGKSPPHNLVAERSEGGAQQRQEL